DRLCGQLHLCEWNVAVPFHSGRLRDTRWGLMGSIDQMHSIASRILKAMKGNNQKVKGCSSLRTSIIINWLMNHSLRKVQYMAGHRYISSPEKYFQDDL